MHEYPDHIHFVSRQDALRAGLPRYFTGKPCKRGHITERRVACSLCYACRDERSIEMAEVYSAKRKERYWKDVEVSREKQRASYAKHREKRRQGCLDYYEKNRDACRSNMKDWYRRNRAEKIAYQRQRRIDNPEYEARYAMENRDRILARYAEYYQKNRSEILKRKQAWRDANRRKIREYNVRNKHLRAKVRAERLKRVYPLTEAQRQDMDHIYQQQQLLAHLGYDYHVDHIIPLLGAEVCGLHVPWNLQLVPARYNLSKGNKLLPHLAEWVIEKPRCKNEPDQG